MNNPDETETAIILVARAILKRNESKLDSMTLETLVRIAVCEGLVNGLDMAKNIYNSEPHTASQPQAAMQYNGD